MAFQARSFPQILEDMIAYVQANTIISDFNVGSVARTLLEAAALEDDEQYFQMVQLLEAFRLSTARGEDLDRRLADFGILRREATTATVYVRFFNRNVKTQRFAVDTSSGSTTIQVFDSTVFPATGFPYTVRVGEGTTKVQDVTVTGNNTATNTLTISTPLTNNMVIGDRVNLVTGASSYVINSGTNIQAAPTASQPAKIYRTQEPAFIAAGNFFSTEVLAKATVTGTRGNVGAQRISQFVSSSPFTGAGVINLTAATGGQNRESDEDFRERALRVLQSLSRGTPLSLQTASIGVTNQVTGQRVVSSNIIEDFTTDEVFVYIDDGSGLTPTVIPLPQDNISGGALLVGSSTVTLASTARFPSNGMILIDEDSSSNPPEVIEYIAKDDATNTLTLATTTTLAHDNGTTVLLIDHVEDNAESGRRRFQLQQQPIVRGTDRIFYDGGAGIVELSPVTDYVLNKGTGEFQLTDLSGAAEGSQLYASYSYYSGLIKLVQRVLEGDIDEPTAFPGVKAAGIFLSVEAPTIRRITVVASISARPGFNESDLADEVRAEIESYISSRKLGEDVILSKIIDVAHNVTGVSDVFISTPTSNVTILENELPVPYNADGESLVTIL